MTPDAESNGRSPPVAAVRAALRSTLRRLRSFFLKRVWRPLADPQSRALLLRRLATPWVLLTTGILGAALLITSALIASGAIGPSASEAYRSQGAAYSALATEVLPSGGGASMGPLAATLTAVSVEADCVLDADYQEDVTVPDNTFLAPGERFVKTWRILNSGTCAWGSGYRLQFMAGAQMGGPDAVRVPDGAPGESVEVSVELVAPEGRGAYRGDWQMRSAYGESFGSMLYIQIIVTDPSDE
jgi:hypothetical protein